MDGQPPKQEQRKNGVIKFYEEHEAEHERRAQPVKIMPGPVYVREASLEVVQQYVYLGQTIQLDRGNFDKEASRWTALKTKVFNQCVLPVMTYGAETWTLTVGLVQQVKVAQRALERAMLGVSLTDKIRIESSVKEPRSETMVDQHNATYPTLASVLEKRKKLATPKVLKTDKAKAKPRGAARTQHRPARFNPTEVSCPTCRCIRILTELQDLNLIPRCSPQWSAQNRIQRRGLPKKRNSPPHKGIPTTSAGPELRISSRQPPKRLPAKKHAGGKSNIRNRAINKERKPSINSRRSSNTSYRSFGSMAHEPMCLCKKYA